MPDLILDQGSLPCGLCALCQTSFPRSVFIAHRSFLFLLSESVIKAHEQARNLPQQPVIPVLFCVLLIIGERASDKVSAVVRIREQFVRGQVRCDRMHGNGFSDIDQVQIAETQEHLPQDLRPKGIFAQFHEQSPVQPAPGEQGQDAEQHLLFFGKSGKSKKPGHPAVNIRGPSIRTGSLVFDL